MQIRRIRDLHAKLNEYERIIKIKIESDLNILLQLAQIDVMMNQSIDDELRIDNIILPSESNVTDVIPMELEDELIELPYQFTSVKSRRGRPKKKRN